MIVAIDIKHYGQAISLVIRSAVQPSHVGMHVAIVRFYGK